MLMPSQKGVKTRKKATNTFHKTRHHSNLRPKHKHSKDFLKVYYPYLPLVMVLFLILAIVQPWQRLASRNAEVLAYATSMNAQELTSETNRRRAQAGLEGLSANKKLQKAAQAKAADMAERDYWSHETPEGNAPWEFINDADYSYKKAGENLAYGFNDAKDVIAGWMNSTSHRQNMLDQNYQEVGFGYVNTPNFEGKGPATIIVAMYGQPSGASDLVTASPAPSYSSAAGMQEQPNTLGISRVQAFTGGALPWASYLVAALIGAMSVFLLLKHGRRLKQTLVHGEQFILHHPLLDVTLISLIVLGVILTRQVGVIL